MTEKQKLIEQAYEIFGNDVPVGTSEFSAHRAAPAVLTIKKAFGSFTRFKEEYLAHCLAVRATVTADVAPKQVTTATKVEKPADGSKE